MNTTYNDNDAFVEPGPLFNTTQRRVLQNVRLAVAPISLLGSSLIFYVLSRDRPTIQQCSPTFRRIMMGLCFFDLVSSATYVVLGPWAVPEASGTSYGAHGTTTTCGVMGFGLHQMLGSGLYSTCLALYHCLVIVYGYKEGWIAKRMEPWMHLISAGFPLVTGSYALAAEFMNPLENIPGFCWIAPYPWHCPDYEEIPCERGEDYLTLSHICGPYLFAPTSLLMVACMWLIFRSVRRTEARLRRYADSGRAAAWEMSRQAGWTGIRYVLSFFLTFIFAVILQVNDTANEDFIWSLLAMIFMPLIGLFNALIFFGGGRWQVLTGESRALHFVTWFWSCRQKADPKKTTTAEIVEAASVVENEGNPRQQQEPLQSLPSEEANRQSSSSSTGQGHDRRRFLTRLDSSREVLMKSLQFQSSLRAVPEYDGNDDESGDTSRSTRRAPSQASPRHDRRYRSHSHDTIDENFVVRETIDEGEESNVNLNDRGKSDSARRFM